MPQGPFGGPRPFSSNRKTVIVLVGVDGTQPPNQILLDMEQLVQDRINRVLDLKPGTLRVAVTSNPNPTPDQVLALGPNTLHVQQYDVETPWEEITQDQINGVHNEVIRQLNDVGTNITDTKTTVV